MFVKKIVLTRNSNFLSRSIIVDDLKLDGILETTSFDDYELIDIHTYMYLWSLTSRCTCWQVSEWLLLQICQVRWGWHPIRGVQGKCVPESTLARGLLCRSSPPHAHVCTYVWTFLEDQSWKFEPWNFMLTSRVDIWKKFTSQKISRYTYLHTLRRIHL